MSYNIESFFISPDSHLINMKNKVLIGLGIVFILSFIFYWYELRPSNIKKNCSGEARENAIEKYNYDGKYNKEDFEHYYSRCLKEKGL